MAQPLLADTPRLVGALVIAGYQVPKRNVVSARTRDYRPPAVLKWHLLPTETATEGSRRRARPGGWVERRRGLCRWCGAEVPKGRFTFCTPACVHEWKLRTDPGYLRSHVFQRDRGVCAQCGLDTEALRKDKRKLDYRARRQFEKDWGGRRNLWDADHILPVAEGGGECDLSNVRTLCLKCHRAVTAELRKRLAVKLR